MIMLAKPKRVWARTLVVVVAGSVLVLTGTARPAQALSTPLSHSAFNVELMAACDRAETQYSVLRSLRDSGSDADRIQFLKDITRVLVQFEGRLRPIKASDANDLAIARDLVSVATRERAVVAKLLPLAKAKKRAAFQAMYDARYPAIDDAYRGVQQRIVDAGLDECAFLPSVTPDDALPTSGGVAPVNPLPVGSPATGAATPFFPGIAGLSWSDPVPEMITSADGLAKSPGFTGRPDVRAFTVGPSSGALIVVPLLPVAADQITNPANSTAATDAVRRLAGSLAFRSQRLLLPANQADVGIMFSARDTSAAVTADVVIAYTRNFGFVLAVESPTGDLDATVALFSQLVNAGASAFSPPLAAAPPVASS
jgi:hypothetical protein